VHNLNTNWLIFTLLYWFNYLIKEHIFIAKLRH